MFCMHGNIPSFNLFRASLADTDNSQNGLIRYRFEGTLQSMKWIPVREPVEFIAPISGTFSSVDNLEINIKENGDTPRVLGTFFGTLTLPSPINRIEKGPAKLIEDESEPEDIPNTGAQVNIDVQIRTIEGKEEVVDVKGNINDGMVLLSDDLLAKLYKVAERYVGLDGDILQSVKDLQIEGTIQGALVKN